MLKGYRLASPGAIIALLSFFLPWFVVSGCQGDTTTVSGVDAVKLMADSSTGVIHKLQYSVPALVIPLLALFVLFMAGWAWGRGRVGKRDIMAVTGSGVMLTLILAWYLFLLRDTILQIRYGFGGELFAAALMLMGGLLNLRIYGLNRDTEEIALPVAPSAWRWAFGAILLTSLCAFTTNVFLPNQPEVTPAFTPSNTTNAPSLAPTTAPLLPSVTATTPAEIIGEPIQYLRGQVECYASSAWVASGDLTNTSLYPIEASVTIHVNKSESFYSESATEYFVIQPGTTESIFFSGPEVIDEPFVEYTCSGSVGAQWADE